MRRPSCFGVIDLRGGRAVHAVAGRRSEYRPLGIAACPDADPLRLAWHYRRIGVDGVYVADLDRILERSKASQGAILRLAEVGLPLWVDAGIRTFDDFAAFALPGSRQTRGCRESPGVREMPNPKAVAIVATETLRSLGDLRQMVEAVAEPQRLAVSLDLRGERVVAECRDLSEQDPLEAARRIVASGAERLIVLDVARVGTAFGPSTAGLCRRLKQELPHLRVVSGGGVRGLSDARTLVEAGCEHVLAGTWLHDLTGGRPL